MSVQELINEDDPTKYRWRSTKRRLELEAKQRQEEEEAKLQQEKLHSKQRKLDIKEEKQRQETEEARKEEVARQEEARLKAEKARRKARWDNEKTAHFYWDGSPLSFLHSLTIRSFHRHNPEWHIKIHTPHAAQRFEGAKTWGTSEQTGVYSGTDYWPHVKNMGFVEICPIDMAEAFGFPNDVPEVFKSDFLRWHLLHDEGGLWSDFDILYVKPIETVINVEDTDVAITMRGTGRHHHHIIGFYIAKPKTSFFKHVADRASGEAQNFNRGGYQTLGSHLIGKVYQTVESCAAEAEASGLSLINLPMSVVYPFDSSPGSISNLLNGSYDNTVGHIKDDTIGIHWYNGHPSAKTYISNFENNLRSFCEDISEPKQQSNLLTYLSQDYLEHII